MTLSDEVQQLKNEILDCYGVDYLHKAFSQRTEDPLFGHIGKIAAPKPAEHYKCPHELIWIGYETLVDSLYADG